MGLIDFLDKLIDALPGILNYFDSLDDVRSFMNDELNKPEYENIDFPEALKIIVEVDGQQMNLWEKAVHEAKKRQQQKNELLKNELAQVRKPAKYVQPKDRVTKMLFKKELDPKEQTDVLFNPNSKKKESLYTTVQLESKDIAVLTDINDFKYIDWLIYGAICSLYECGSTRFTAHDIYRMFTKITNTKTPTDFIECVDNAFIKFQTSIITLTLSNDLVLSCNAKVRHVKRKPLINGETDIVTFENQHGTFTTVTYKVLDKPVLLSYAENFNHIWSFNTSLLATPQRKSIEFIQAEHYLLYRIHTIPETSNIVLLDKIYSFYDFVSKNGLQMNDVETSKKKSKIRSALNKALDYWVENGLITRYKYRKEGNEYKSIELFKQVSIEDKGKPKRK